MVSKKALILALVLVNAGLLGVLVVVNSSAPQAQAGIVPEAVGRFAVIAQAIDDQRSILWALDTVSRRLIAYSTDRQTGRMFAVGSWDLNAVFRYRPEVAPTGREVKPPRP